MVEKYNIRTDLALEEKERFESDHVEVQGVILTEEYDEENEIRITTVRIETENGAKVMGKPVGSYITIEAPEMAAPDEGYHEEISQQLRKFIGELLPKRKMEKILVVGLGNRQVTPDALGPYVVDNLHITRHIIEEYGKYATGEDEVWSVSAIVPGVMGQTGMETVEVIRGVVAETKPDSSHVPKWKQITSLVVLIAVILAMIFEKQIGIPIQVSACIGACVVVLTGVISGKAALKSIDLKVVLLFGGSLALANALDTSGAGTMIADTIVGFLGKNPSPMILLLVIFVVSCVLTNFMSNTATTALMVPIAVSMSDILGADPRAVVIATVIAASCAYATPIGMPANTMVVGLGGYTFKDYVKSGLPLILVSFALCMILLPILFPFYH
jgi:di/tricarboxylate transporter